MSTAKVIAPIQGEPELLGQTVVVIGGSAGIGFETARRARAEGANLILTRRNPQRLQRAASEVEAKSTAAFDATDFQLLEGFFDDLTGPVDHVLVTGSGPYYGALSDFDFDAARRDIEAHLLLPMHLARNARNKVRPGGTLLFMGGTGGRRVGKGMVLISALTAALPALTKNLALESTGSSQPHRRRVRRHTPVRAITGRRTRQPSQPASQRAADRTRSRSGGRGRARCTHYGQDGADRCNVRH